MKEIAPTLPVSNITEALKYYCEILGFESCFVNESVFAMIKRDQIRIGLQMENEQRLAGSGNCYIWSDDVKALYQEYVGTGARIKNQLALQEEYNLTDFVITDIDGNHIGIGG